MLGAMIAVVIGCQPGDAAWRMTLAGASPGGAWSAIGEAVTDELRQGIPGSAFTLEPGQDGANAVLVQSGQVELGLVHSSIALAAIDGTSPFESPQPDVRAVMLIYADAPFHFVVDQRAGLRSFEQLRDERIPLRLSVNTRGSLMELATRTALQSYGITYDDIRDWGGSVVFEPLNPSYEAMQRGRMDAIGVTVQVPSRHAVDAGRKVDLNLLPLSDEAVAFSNEALGTDVANIPSDAYTFLERDIPTFAGRVILVTSEDVSEEQIYHLTEVLHDRLERIRRAHRSLQNLTPATMADVGGVPLHPGAARFYRERGLR